MNDVELIRKVGKKISEAESTDEVNALTALLRAVINDDLEEIRVRTRFFAEKYGHRDKGSDRAA